MKTTKGGKVMNPTDAYRKQIRKREIKRVRAFVFSILNLPFLFCWWNRIGINCCCSCM